MFDKKKFFSAVRRLFGKLNQKQVEGIEAILDAWIESPLNDIRWLAYILATAWHETGTRMEAVREGFANSNEGAIAAVTKLFQRGVIKRNYALPHANGNSYYGRGLVQLTHGHNYATMSNEVGIDLYENPDEALRLDIAVKILIIGMIKGLFTGRRLADYFNNTDTNWINARRIVNGSDKASQIAKYAKDFYLSLKQSGDLFNKLMEKEIEDEEPKKEKVKTEPKKDDKTQKSEKTGENKEEKKSKAVDPKKNSEKDKTANGKSAGKAESGLGGVSSNDEESAKRKLDEDSSGEGVQSGSQDGKSEGNSEGDNVNSSEGKTE